MATSIKIADSYYTAFNKKNWSEMLSHLSPQVSHELNQGETQVGSDLFKKFMDHMNECYDEFLEDIVLFDGGDGRVAAEFFVKGKYLKTDGKLPEAQGQTYRIRAGAFLEVHQGKITRVTTYYNLPEWIKAVQVTS